MDVLPGSAHSDSKLDRSHSNYTYYHSFLTTYCYFSLLTRWILWVACVLLISCWTLTFLSISYYDTFIVIIILTIISFWMYQFYSVSCVFYWYLARDLSLSSVSVTIPLTIITFSYYYSHSNYTYFDISFYLSGVVFCELYVLLISCWTLITFFSISY